MRTLRKITLRRLADVAWAAVLLGRAWRRIRTGSQAGTAGIGDPQALWSQPSDAQRSVIDRASWAVAVAARYVPWRSDCLVQALAARDFLAAHSIESRMVLGVPRQKGPQFEAHAWLLSHGITVTGGDVARYNAFPAA